MEAEAEAVASGRKLDIEGYNAETSRLSAVLGKGAMGPSAQALLAPLITQAVMQALSSPDILPLDLQQELASEAFDQAANPPEVEQGGAMAPEQEAM